MLNEVVHIMNDPENHAFVTKIETNGLSTVINAAIALIMAISHNIGLEPNQVVKLIWDKINENESSGA